jgi:NUDIX domain
LPALDQFFDRLITPYVLGKQLWTLPVGKVKRGESLVKELKRELYEETGLDAQIGSLLGVLDRRAKDAITLLFAAVPKKTSVKVNQNQKEIEKADLQTSLPKKASPSASGGNGRAISASGWRSWSGIPHRKTTDAAPFLSLI